MFWLITLLTSTAKTTKPSHPKIASLRCVALQRPILPARLRGDRSGEEDMLGSLHFGSGSRLSVDPTHRPSGTAGENRLARRAGGEYQPTRTPPHSEVECGA